MQLLSIDWDFFFVDPAPILKTWVPGSDPQDTLFRTWLMRAQMYLQFTKTIPGTSREEQCFWYRFRFSPACTLFSAEEHVHAADPVVMDGITTVWNFDAHHDCGYEERSPTRTYADENWLMAYPESVDIRVRYPTWKSDAFKLEPTALRAVKRDFDDGQQVDVTFDRVFVCRSHQFAPPWLDAAYDAFVSQCPVPLQHAWPLIPRDAIAARVKSEIEKQGHHWPF